MGIVKQKMVMAATVSIFGVVLGEGKWRYFISRSKRDNGRPWLPQVILMVGMPGSGKTFWARAHAAKHSERRYNILSTGALFDKMKVLHRARALPHYTALHDCSTL